MVQSLTSAKSKFLSLKLPAIVYLTAIGHVRERMTKAARSVLCLSVLSVSPVNGSSTQPTLLSPATNAAAPSSIVEYENYGGHLEIQARGDLNSSFTIRYEFDGLYVASWPILSDLIDQGYKPPPSPYMYDKYLIVPKNTRVSVQGSVRGGSQITNTTKCGEYQHSLSASFNLESPTERDVMAFVNTGMSGPRISNPINVSIIDRSPSGGDAEVSLWASDDDIRQSLDPASWSTSTHLEVGSAISTYFDGPGQIRGTSEGVSKISWWTSLGLPDCRPGPKISVDGVSEREQTAKMRVRACSSERLVLANGFKLDEFEISGGFTDEGANSGNHCSYVGNDRHFVFDVSFRFAAIQHMATLEAKDEDEAAWMPVPAETRDYVVKLHDLEPDEVEAVRFTLDGSSKHPGVATNAVAHLVGSADDCIQYQEIEQERIALKFHDIPIFRAHDYYVECAVDFIEDIYFRQPDNPGFEWDEVETLEGLRYPISQQITREDPEEEEIVVRVAVMDSAASVRLRAEIKVGGIWHKVEAEGATAVIDRGIDYLMLPLDKNGNSIHDDWEKKHGIKEVREDSDTHEGDENPGDGLTAFEEYRGFFLLTNMDIPVGEPTRTDPTKKDIFVQDYSGEYEPYLESVKEKFARQDLHLWMVSAGEMKGEVVNYNKTDHKQGDQYVIVIMDSLSDQLMADAELKRKIPNYKGYITDEILSWNFAGKASHVGPPTRKHHTVVMNPYHEFRDGKIRKSLGPHTVGTLAHEIGHQINIPHHGNIDIQAQMVTVCDQGGAVYVGSETINWIRCDNKQREELAYVAVKGGQHSGNIYSFMTYRNAWYFCEGPESYSCIRRPLKKFPRELVNRQIFSPDQQGTGFNSNGQWAGDATTVGDLPRLRVKSYP